MLAAARRNQPLYSFVENKERDRPDLRALMLDLPGNICGRYPAAAIPVLHALRGAGGFLREET